MTGARIDIPPTSTLIAFETTARLGSVTLAARELATSQSAISRHIRNLEETLGMALFQRSGRGIVLTKSGGAYFLAVQSSMDSLRAAAHALHTSNANLTIGCTLEISGLILQPVFSRLKRFLGEEVEVRIVVYDYDRLPLLVGSGLDITFEGLLVEHSDRDAVKMLDEEIVPVAAPAFLERYGPVLAENPRHWSGVPRLEIGQCSPGWATWGTWFDAHGCAPPDAPVETFEHHVHLLRAAAEGDGIAIGWNGFMAHYVETGQLVAIREEWLRTKLTMYGVPTPSGKRNRVSTACLHELARLVKGLCSPMPVVLRPEGRREDSKSTA